MTTSKNPSDREKIKQQLKTNDEKIKIKAKNIEKVMKASNYPKN